MFDLLPLMPLAPRALMFTIFTRATLLLFLRRCYTTHNTRRAFYWSPSRALLLFTLVAAAYALLSSSRAMLMRGAIAAPLRFCVSMLPPAMYAI